MTTPSTPPWAPDSGHATGAGGREQGRAAHSPALQGWDGWERKPQRERKEAHGAPGERLRRGERGGAQAGGAPPLAVEAGQKGAVGVEWVEVVGKTVDEATELALDQLGVAVSDAEVIVVSEPKPGLFGRLRGEARVRARVRPVGARPKRERGRDRTRGRGGSGARQGTGRPETRSTNGSGAARSPRAPGSGSNGSPRAQGGSAGGSGAGAAGEGRQGSSPGAGTSRSARRRRNRRETAGTGRPADTADTAGTAGTAAEHDTASRNGHRDRQDSVLETKETDAMAEGMTLEEQGEVGRSFLEGLMREYGMEATVVTRLLDEETVEIAATGEDLGMLVGPRGSTLSALQDVTRAVVQRQCPSRTDRILVDVAGYREKRSAALKRFSTQIAEEVLASGQEKALEAMSPADRKAVHDAVNDLDGVVTRSEGEDPNRYIVISPAG